MRRSSNAHACVRGASLGASFATRASDAPLRETFLINARSSRILLSLLRASDFVDSFFFHFVPRFYIMTVQQGDPWIADVKRRFDGRPCIGVINIAFVLLANNFFIS